jgi:hypothetical protein
LGGTAGFGVAVGRGSAGAAGGDALRKRVNKDIDGSWARKTTPGA